MNTNKKYNFAQAETGDLFPMCLWTNPLEVVGEAPFLSQTQTLSYSPWAVIVLSRIRDASPIE